MMLQSTFAALLLGLIHFHLDLLSTPVTGEKTSPLGGYGYGASSKASYSYPTAKTCLGRNCAFITRSVSLFDHALFQMPRRLIVH